MLAEDIKSFVKDGPDEDLEVIDFDDDDETMNTQNVSENNRSDKENERMETAQNSVQTPRRSIQGMWYHVKTFIRPMKVNLLLLIINMAYTPHI